MEWEWLAAELEAGRSIESIARELARPPSTVAYWVNKYGLASRHAAKHRTRGGIPRDALMDLVAEGLSVRGIAAQLDRSPTTVRHWLATFGLHTSGSRPQAGEADGARDVVRECRVHGWTAWVRVPSGRYRCKRCRIEAVSAAPARQADPS